jgi:hypothetical protein
MHRTYMLLLDGRSMLGMTVVVLVAPAWGGLPGAETCEAAQHDMSGFVGEMSLLKPGHSGSSTVAYNRIYTSQPVVS